MLGGMGFSAVEIIGDSQGGKGYDEYQKQADQEDDEDLILLEDVGNAFGFLCKSGFGLDGFSVP